MNEQLKHHLIKIAQRDTWIDSDDEDECEFTPQEWAGGNFDDCFAGGIRVGEAAIARQVLSAFGISWQE